MHLNIIRTVLEIRYYILPIFNSIFQKVNFEYH